MTMSSLFESDATSAPVARYSEVHPLKSSGATRTPAHFARFVADHMVRVAQLPGTGPIRVLDPAVGDGALLEALIRALPAPVRARVEGFGYDTDPAALQTASRRLKNDFPDVRVELVQKDFLSQILSPAGGSDFLSPEEEQNRFDLVIANPPYVRTQILGARQAREIAKRFGLTGRVDLYYPFLLGISQVLAPHGVTGVITSNRFMTTKSGQAVRRALLSRFRVIHAWDLGDTKLFDTAVLPSVLLARGASEPQRPHAEGILYSSIYETNDPAETHGADALAALSAGDGVVVAIPDGRRFRVRHGRLENGGDPQGTWRIATTATDGWLETVRAHTWSTFGRIGKVRVGVKSTADKVFVRSDWDALPGGRPELLRPLMTRHVARRFKADVPRDRKHIKEILYPHEVVDGERRPVDLERYPNAAKYLAAHRGTLERRTYVIEAGRRWYELWVPHNPDAWSRPKLVFLDIASKPVFWLDTDGAVVNGECYWLRCEQESEQDLLWLALAVANSTFIEAFYDHRFNNKLYAGRRRFITQYVEQFPLPDPARAETAAIIDLARKLYAAVPAAEADDYAAELDKMVWRVFGLDGEEVMG